MGNLIKSKKNKNVLRDDLYNPEFSEFETGNKLTEFKTLIFCPTCAIFISQDETSPNYAVIKSMPLAPMPIPVTIPVPNEWCHIFKNNRLAHVKSVSRDKNNNLIIQEDVYQIK